MKRAVALMFAVTMLTGVLFVEPGVAGTTPTYKTSLHLKVSDTTPNYKTKVVFTAHLKSPKPKCFKNKPVKLLRNGEVLRSKKTNTDGIVKWTITIRANGKWKAKFHGRTYGTHPNEYICSASVSNVVSVRVQNKP